jgi:hypothetical protein
MAEKKDDVVDSNKHIVNDLSDNVSNNVELSESIKQHARNESASNNKRSFEEEDGEDSEKKEISKSKRFSVRIDGFLRPFTLKQAKEMIEEQAGAQLLEVLLISSSDLRTFPI